MSTEFVPFKSIDDVSTRLSGQSYICSRNIATVVFLATRLGKPVLVEGPAGVGKTELAKVIAAATSANLIRMQCYEGLDEAKALYEWEYAKQLLYTQILKDKIQNVTEGTSTLAEAVDKLTAEDDVFFSERFILARPLLQAIESSEPSVLLIDEIDKADAEFEAFLLEILSEFQVTIPEIGTIKAKTIPMVILTSNNAREMSDALKRRCLHLYIDFPTEELEREILRVKVPEAEAGLAAEITGMVQSMRNLDLKKAPSISETLDWARALVLMNVSELDQDAAHETLSVVLKYEGDLRKGEKELKAYANKKLEALNKTEADSQDDQEAGKQDSDANGGQLH
ncbi:MAG TPA: MoxR family ATPase [Deltaproteobacteria bacterium]|nr:MoxR family ATPase [Candidatus Binatota bacterium]HIL13786.1 MoxR family ATPase [Deltaproteobacteria bacterium]